MANFTPSALLAGQALFNDKFISAEWRLPDTAALQAATLAEPANPMLAELRTREDRAVYAYFPIRQAAGGGTTRDHAHTAAVGDSLSDLIAWNTFSEKFTLSEKLADNNMFSLSQMYAFQLRNAVYNLMARINTAFVAALVAGKTGVNAGGGVGEFNGTDDVYEVPRDEKDYVFQNVRQSMRYNLYNPSNLIGIVDTKLATYMERLLNSGSANAINYGFQLAGMTVFPTTEDVLGSDYDGSGIFFENGLVAAIPWIPKQNRKPLDMVKALEYNGDKGSFTVPEFPNVNFAIHAYAARADRSMSGGSAQDLVMEFEVSIDMGFIDSPLSTIRGAGDTVIYAAGLLKS